MKQSPNPLIIYNLFPRFFTSVEEWIARIPAIDAMGFNAIFINPFFETGFSGSLYAVKNYYRCNPVLIGKELAEGNFSPIEQFRDECHSRGIELFIDLVINHTAFDAELTHTHPEWYMHGEDGALVSPSAIDPGDESKVTVWGDLASIDNNSSQHKKEIWAYWDALISFFQTMGIHGFRCDAAYQVPVTLWQFLIHNAKKRNTKATFLAETLGCRLEEIEALATAGFDYLFNSVKWWQFDESWAIDQHSANRLIAPSIAFPESHDTERLAAEPPGTIHVQKKRYAVSAVFSQGLLMPMGYETGATTRMDVVKGKPEDLDQPQWELSQWIKSINALKRDIPVLSEEGIWQVLGSFNEGYLFLYKKSECGNKSIGICINKNDTAETEVEEWMVPEEIRTMKFVISLLTESPQKEDIPLAFTLDPADIVLFLD